MQNNKLPLLQMGNLTMGLTLPTIRPGAGPQGGVKKKFGSREFQGVIPSTQKYLSEKPGVIIVEEKTTGRVLVYHAYNLRARMRHIIFNKDGNQIYRLLGGVYHGRLNFWYSPKRIAETKSMETAAKELREELGLQLYRKRTENEPIPGHRGYMVKHKESGYYALLLRLKTAFSLGDYICDLNRQLDKEYGKKIPVSVLAMKSYRGDGFRFEDFEVTPLFSGVEKRSEAIEQLRQAALEYGSEHLITARIIPRHEWKLHHYLCGFLR